MLNNEATEKANQIAMQIDEFLTAVDSGSQITAEEYALFLEAEERFFAIRDRGIVRIPAA